MRQIKVKGTPANLKQTPKVIFLLQNKSRAAKVGQCGFVYRHRQKITKP